MTTMFDKLKKPDICFNDVSMMIEKKVRKDKESVQHFFEESTQKKLIAEESKYLKLGGKYTLLRPDKSVNDMTDAEAIDIYEGVFKRHARSQFLKQYSKVCCPICGHFYPPTLDHVLPKTKYAQYTVTPINLVPMCTYCNGAKGQSDIGFHPYFQDFSQLDGLNFEFNFVKDTVVSVRCSKKELDDYLRVYKMNIKLAGDANNLLRDIKNGVVRLSDNLPSYQGIINLIKNQRDNDVRVKPWEIIFYNDLLENMDSFYDELVNERA